MLDLILIAAILTALAGLIGFHLGRRWILSTAIIIGLIGFLGGFFGPLYFTPQANQGPLLGFFVTGPLGFIAGGLIGGVIQIVKNRRSH